MGYPVVTSSPADEETETRAHLYGACADSGNGYLTGIGFIWGTNSRTDEQVDNLYPSEAGYNISYGYGVGTWGVPKSWDSTSGQVAPDTLHYWRAIARGPEGWSYSEERTFTTLPITVCDVTTHAATSIRASTAVGNGEITDRHAGTVDHRGIVYGETSRGDPGNTAYDSTAYDGYVDEEGAFGETTFWRKITGLSSLTQIFFRAYAHNDAGYSYGEELDFTTLAGSPARFLMMKMFEPLMIRAGG